MEVKRCEHIRRLTWWGQAKRQARPDQLPVLMYRQSHAPWRFMTELSVGNEIVVVELDEDNAKRLLQEFARQHAD